MTKAFRKAIMRRSRLKNIYLKNQSQENWVNYKRQQNFCTNLHRKTKQKYFCSLKMKDLNDNKRFQKKIKPLFLEKGLKNITDSSIIAITFNNYFINITDTLDMVTTTKTEVKNKDFKKT